MNSSYIYYQNKYEQNFDYNFPFLRIQSLYSEIIQSVESNLITIISSKTGSGKSTQVPIFLYDLLDQKKNSFSIICTEPRSIACDSLCQYLIRKTHLHISKDVRSYSNCSDKMIFFFKESDLLYLLKEDPYLEKCDILIIDEVHERTMKLDLILYYIKHFTLSTENRKRGFKLVLMSATFNTDGIHNYFSSMKDKNFTFGFIDQKEAKEQEDDINYNIIYTDSIKSEGLYYGNTKFNDFNMKKILREIIKIVRYEIYLNDYFNKTILIFLPDYKTIYSLCNSLNKEYRTDSVRIYQFNSALSILQQNEILDEIYKSNKNKYKTCNVVLATTLAETCLTFPNCDIVIDCGLKKNCRYNYDSNMYEELIEYISQDSCIQRSGRCGRENNRNKGICYRIFSRESYDLMEKYRKPDIETSNIDLIILKLFENEIMIKHVKEEIQEKGYIDFLSNIDKEKFNKIVDKLTKYKAIEMNEDKGCEVITQFGFWALKANMDIELGYYFDRFKSKYPEDIEKEVVFQLLNIISTTDNYNCELFYTNVDIDAFKFILIDNNKNSKDNKTLVDFSQNISKNIIKKGLAKFCKEKDDKISSYMATINHISPYYYLYSQLDEFYSAKNYYTKNKIFQLGDWIISLFFINQYKLIKCLIHNYFPKEKDVYCKQCQVGKYYYCNVYALNEKYFNNQKSRTNHIKNVLKFHYMNEDDFCVCKEEEAIISKWNTIYLNLISYKPDVYIDENQIIKYINEFKYINLNNVMEKLYISYKELYIDIATKYLDLTRNDDEMLIMKRTFKNNENEDNQNTIKNMNDYEEENYKITLFFNKNEKVNLMKSYFFDFIPKEIDKYFCFTKFRKILENNKNNEENIKASKLFYKIINPIFDEMLSKSYKIKNHFDLLKAEIVDKKEIKLYTDIGKYFYYYFISPKIKENNIEVQNNSIIYIYNKIERDFNKEDEISELIKNEKENYYNMMDFIQCLKNGCITIQITQGLSVKNIYDTYHNRNTNQNELLYLIKFNGDCNIENQNITEYYHDLISKDQSLIYERLYILEDKLIIVFKDSFQFFKFSKNQNLNLKLIPFKNNEDEIKDSEEINNNMKIYIVKFDSNFSIGEIHKKMGKYRKRIMKEYDYKIFYFIDEARSNDFNSIFVYYYIISESPINIPEKEIYGEECKEDLNKKSFSITSMSFTSDFEYFVKFNQFCEENNLKLNFQKQKFDRPTRFYTRKYELINYSIENMKLIQNYIGITTINLNSFAIKELTSKCNDTEFLEYDINIFKYARNLLCNIKILYYDNKIIIYGRPEYRLRLYKILSDYFIKLQNDKIIYTLKGKEDKLFLRTLCKKVSQKKIVVLVSNNEQGEQQLEFRKKYYDIISELLLKKKRKKTNKQIKSTRCEICLEKFDNEFNNNYIKLKLCGHKFCIECLKLQICNSLKMTSANSIPIKCVKCNTIIANNDIFEIIIPNTPEYDFIIDKLITIFMIRNTTGINRNSDIEYYWCPNKKENCNYIYSSKIKDLGETVMTCPNCECKICLLCNDLIDPTVQHNPDCQSKLFSKISEKNRKWILSNSKDCPICHTVYEKNQGCNHMTCTICRPPTHFCYLCGNILNNENPLSHFSSTESKCYNKLWDDEKPNNILEENNNDSDERKDSDNDNDNNTDNKYDNSENDNEGQYDSYRNNETTISKRTNPKILAEKVINKIAYNSSYGGNNYENKKQNNNKRASRHMFGNNKNNGHYQNSRHYNDNDNDD